MNTEPKAHPFELAGMGVGPFRWVGMVSIPSTSLAEANPDAYNNALAALPRDLVGGCGTCANCGKAISVICIVANAAGQRYGVGSDCIAKTGDACLGDKAKVAVARHRRHQAWVRKEAKRQANRQAWEQTVCNDRGETNAQRLDREHAEEKAAKVAREQTVLDKFGFLLPHLTGPEGGFCDSIARGIRNGNAPRGRALDICAEIYAKSFGRRGSKGFDQGLDDFNAKVGEEVL